MDPLLNFLPQELVDKINGMKYQMEMIANAKAKYELHHEFKMRLANSILMKDTELELDTDYTPLCPIDEAQKDIDWFNANPYKILIDFWDKTDLINSQSIWDMKYFKECL